MAALSALLDMRVASVEFWNSAFHLFHVTGNIPFIHFAAFWLKHPRGFPATLFTFCVCASLLPATLQIQAVLVSVSYTVFCFSRFCVFLILCRLLISYLCFGSRKWFSVCRKLLLTMGSVCGRRCWCRGCPTDDGWYISPQLILHVPIQPPSARSSTVVCYSVISVELLLSSRK